MIAIEAERSHLSSEEHLSATPDPSEELGVVPGGQRGPGLPWSIVGSLLNGARSVVGDPRTAGLLRAGLRVAQFVAGCRQRNSLAETDDTVLRVPTTPGLAAQAYVDEVLIAAFRHPDLFPKEQDFEPASLELASARSLFEKRGWLDDPASYHTPLPAPDDARSTYHHTHSIGYEKLSFTSGWEPYREEPGRQRWMAHQANQTVHAFVARAPGHTQKKWLVCAHGFGMGSKPLMDLRAFRASRLHAMGVNVVIPVMPLHGERSSGRVKGEDLMTISMVDSMHGVAQAVSDVRRLIKWLREVEGAEEVGVAGLSLGGLVAALVASLEDDLSCVVAGIPVVDLPDLFRRHSPPDIAATARRYGVLGEVADQVHSVVSPLAMECNVPSERRYIFAGLGDRMSSFGQARRLWLHWNRPSLCAYTGGHVGFYWSGAVKRFVDEAVSTSFQIAADPSRPGSEVSMSSSDRRQG
ncbi:MAG: alpha/beta hydrolase family protein [Acidimicrobiales bacterium]